MQCLLPLSLAGSSSCFSPHDQTHSMFPKGQHKFRLLPDVSVKNPARTPRFVCCTSMQLREICCWGKYAPMLGGKYAAEGNMPRCCWGKYVHILLMKVAKPWYIIQDFIYGLYACTRPEIINLTLNRNVHLEHKTCCVSWRQQRLQMKLWYDDDLLDLVQEPLWSKPVVHSRAPSLPLHIIAYSLVWLGSTKKGICVQFYISLLCWQN